MKNRTQRYIDVLQDVVHSYNHTVHRSLGKPQASITRDNEGESRLQQYLLRQSIPKSRQTSKKNIRKSFRYIIDQTVRVSHVRSLFDTEYSQKWTGEIFKIKTRLRRDGIPVYTLVDWDDEIVESTFYEQEIQAVCSSVYWIQHWKDYEEKNPKQTKRSPTVMVKLAVEIW